MLIVWFQYLVLLIYFVSYNVQCCWCPDFPLLSPPVSSLIWSILIFSVFLCVFFKLFRCYFVHIIQCTIIVRKGITKKVEIFHDFCRLLLLWLSTVITSGGKLDLIKFDIQCFLYVFLNFCSMIVGTLTLHCYHLRWQAGTWKPTNCATNCGRRLN